MTIPGAELIAHLRPPREDLDLLGVPEDPAIVGLFEGYGGLTMGVQHALGGRLVAYSEIEPSALRLLAAHYPDVPNLGDISAVDWTSWRGRIDVALGGFPCQDVSPAGLGAGLHVGTRSGLWHEFARMIHETRPALVVIENVPGLRWAPAGIKSLPPEVESDDGLSSDLEPESWPLGDDDDRPVLRALGAVLGDLAELGYLASWDSIRGSDVGAPHKRERVFIIAARG